MEHTYLPVTDFVADLARRQDAWANPKPKPPKAVWAFAPSTWSTAIAEYVYKYHHKGRYHEYFYGSSDHVHISLKPWKPWVSTATTALTAGPEPEPPERAKPGRLFPE